MEMDEKTPQFSRTFFQTLELHDDCLIKIENYRIQDLPHHI